MSRTISHGANLLRNVSSTLAGTGITAIIGITTFGLLARNLGAPGLGAYRTVLTLLLFAGIAFDLGIYAITLREISQPNVDAGRILGNATVLRVAATACGVLILTALLTISRYGAVIRHGVLIAGVGWVGYQLNELMRSVFQSRLKQYFGAIAEITGGLVTLALVVVLAFHHAGTDAMLAATAAGFVCSATVACYFASRLVPFRLRVEWSVWRAIVIAGLPVGGSMILLACQMRSDIFMLSLLRTPAEVGLYDGPAKLYEFAFLAPFLVGGLVMPFFVRDLASAQGSLAPRLNSAVGISFILSGIVFAVLFVEGEPIIVLLAGSAFAKSATPLRILGAAAAFAGVTSISRFAATALGQQQKMLRADMVGLATAVIANVILIPRYGFVGAAYGKLIADFVRATATITILRKQFTRALLASVAIAVCTTATLIALLDLARNHGMNWLIASIVVGALTLGGLLFVPRVRQDLSSLAA